MAISARLATALNERPSFTTLFTGLSLHMQTKTCPNHALHTPAEAKLCESQRAFTTGTICGALDILKACNINLTGDITTTILLDACRKAKASAGDFQWMLEELIVNLEALNKCIKDHPVS